MTVFGLCAIAAVMRLLPETMHRPAAGGLSFSSTLRDYGGFLRHRSFLLYLAILATSYGGLFAWLSGSSFALQNFYGLSPLVFGVVFASTTLGYLAGTLLAAKLVGRIGIDRTILLGGFGLAAGGLAMVATVGLDVQSPLALALPITLYIAGLGLAMPQCMAGALTPFPGRAGSASSLLGFVQQVVASSLGIVVGQLLVSSALPLAGVIAVMGCLSLALAFLNLAIRRRG
jgi:DHA1 family bicyclomycin/chloramphenicol resistance-like MFS transporter